jgi:hypothetical protein
MVGKDGLDLMICLVLMVTITAEKQAHKPLSI